jgi:hypothetical protein
MKVLQNWLFVYLDIKEEIMKKKLILGLFVCVLSLSLFLSLSLNISVKANASTSE